MLRAILLASLFACAASPAAAQLDAMFQGPWNVHAQPYSRANTSRLNWVPPRNKQCGWYLRNKRGIADADLNLAANWARKRPRTSAGPGAVVVWRHHVAEIVSMSGRCRATVHDNAGTYQRDICRGVMAYVR